MFDDALSQSAAETQAFLVNEYWARLGWDAGAYVIPRKQGAHTWYLVRSNMKNGVPTRKIKEITQ